MAAPIRHLNANRFPFGPADFRSKAKPPAAASLATAIPTAATTAPSLVTARHRLDNAMEAAKGRELTEAVSSATHAASNAAAVPTEAKQQARSVPTTAKEPMAAAGPPRPRLANPQAPAEPRPRTRTIDTRPRRQAVQADAHSTESTIRKNSSTHTSEKYGKPQN